MNLYLSSFMIGDHADRLLAMAGGGGRMAIITNALDGFSFDHRLAYFQHRIDPDAYFASYGFDPSLIDLRHYFGRATALKDLLLRHKVIWVLGGNTFLLRRAMRESGFDEIIRDVLASGVVYGGWSAGACVMGDSLRAVAIMDEPEAEAPGYPSRDVIWEGLGFAPFTILPHYESNHVEAPLAAKAAIWAMDCGICIRTLRDGDVLVMESGAPLTLLPRRH